MFTKSFCGTLEFLALKPQNQNFSALGIEQPELINSKFLTNMSRETFVQISMPRSFSPTFADYTNGVVKIRITIFAIKFASTSRSRSFYVFDCGEAVKCNSDELLRVVTTTTSTTNCRNLSAPFPLLG
uniref:Uncharacterized protein n=1 Tax=Romanomermis culicivorax TaxID=13658 RepID=A0A915K2K0_ROMCU